jgi:hypothetical protein
LFSITFLLQVTKKNSTIRTKGKEENGKPNVSNASCKEHILVKNIFG